MAISWRGPRLVCMAMTAVAAAWLLSSGPVEAGLQGYGEPLEALDVRGFACVPAADDGGEEPRADIEWVRAAASSSNHLAADGIVSARATGSGNLYADPRAATGGPDASSGWFSLGAGGHLMGRMQAPVDDGAGADLLVAEHVGLADPFCVYGSLGPSGPWVFIGWWHGFENEEVVAFDLGTHFIWQETGTRLDHVLIVDAALQAHTHVDFVVMRAASTPVNVSGAAVLFRDQTLIRPVGSASYHWDFGDGATSTIQHPRHSYDTPGVYEACLEVRLNGEPGQKRCKDVPVENRPPVPAAQGVWQDASRARFLDASTDPDGEILSRTWTLPDGSSASGPDTGVVPLPEGLDGSVCIAVEDDQGATARRCYALAHLAGSAPASRLPETVIVMGGQSLRLDLGVQDPDDHPFQCLLLEGPPDVSLGSGCTLEWHRPGEGTTCLILRFEDITTLATERPLCLQASASRGDLDRDGAPDSADNCPGTPNRGQDDSDQDGVGDACSPEAAPSTGAAGDDAGEGPTSCPAAQETSGCQRDAGGVAATGSGSLDCPPLPHPTIAARESVEGDCRGRVGEVADAPACTGRCGAVVLAGACDDCAPPPAGVGTRQLLAITMAFAVIGLGVAGAVAFMTRSSKPGP